MFKGGSRFSLKGMRLHRLPNSLEISRVVFVTVRSYPGAVERNRARRVLRECWRLSKGSLRPGFDVVVVLYPGNDDYEARREQLWRLLRQAGLLVETT